MNRRRDVEPDSGSDDGDSPGTVRQMGRYGGHGLTIGVATALFAWLGHLLDGLLGTGGLFAILGGMAGFGGAFYSMYRDLMAEDAPGDDDAG